MSRFLHRFFRFALLGVGLIASSVLMSQLAQAEVLKQIQVEGLQRIERETVKAYLTIQEGQSYSQDDIDASLKKLYASGLFTDISIESKGPIVVVRVEENPIINRIAFEGNKRIESKKLEKEIMLRPRVAFTRGKVQSDVQRLFEVYRKMGRFSVKIEPKIIKLDQNRVDLVFEIDEGPQAHVKRMTFVGNHYFGDSKLERVIATKQWRWYRFFSSDDIYDPDRLDYDKELLRRLYLNHGFADFKVNSVVTELSSDKKDFYITFTIEEGEQYKVNEVRIDSSLNNLKVEPLEAVLEVKSGDRYSLDAIESTVKALTNAAGEQQFAFVDINPRVSKNKEEHTVNLTFVINEGPKVFIERININGNTRTIDKVVRRELEFSEGDAYNTSRMAESQKNIRNLNYFDKVEIEKTEGSDEELTVVDVNVSEKSTGQLNFGVGYSTLDGPMADFGVYERNFLGKGQIVDLSTKVSKRTQSYNFGFTEPYFMDKPLSAGFDVFHHAVNNEEESSYREKNTGFRTRLGYNLTKHLSQTVFYKFAVDEISHVKSTASRFIKEEQGRKYVSVVGQYLFYDRLDNRNDPTEGYFASLNTDLAGVGGNIRYISNIAKAGYYYPIFDQVIFSNIYEAGLIEGLNQDVRIADRFLLGGTNLRGFRYGGVGPRDLTSGDSLGGNRYYRGSFEVTTPIGLPEEFGVKAHFYSDFGSLTGVDVHPLPGDRFVKDNAIRWSAGTGISWRSPFGPIRLDFAKALSKKDYDRVKVFRFGIGSRF